MRRHLTSASLLALWRDKATITRNRWTDGPPQASAFLYVQHVLFGLSVSTLFFSDTGALSFDVTPDCFIGHLSHIVL